MLEEKRDYKKENKQLLMANANLQNEAVFWKDKYKDLLKEYKKVVGKDGR